MKETDKSGSGCEEICVGGSKRIKPRGFLGPSSCTNLLSPKLFLDTVMQAAKDAKRKVRQVLFQTQSPDHPIIPNQENTHYLKFLIVQVL